MPKDKWIYLCFFICKIRILDEPLLNLSCSLILSLPTFGEKHLLNFSLPWCHFMLSSNTCCYAPKTNIFIRLIYLIKFNKIVRYEEPSTLMKLIFPSILIWLTSLNFWSTTNVYSYYHFIQFSKGTIYSHF